MTVQDSMLLNLNTWNWQAYKQSAFWWCGLRTCFYYEAKSMNMKVEMLIIVKAYQCVWKEPSASSHAGGPGSGWFLAEPRRLENLPLSTFSFFGPAQSWDHGNRCVEHHSPPTYGHHKCGEVAISIDECTPEKQKSVYYTREVWMTDIAKKIL